MRAYDTRTVDAAASCARSLTRRERCSVSAIGALAPGLEHQWAYIRVMQRDDIGWNRTRRCTLVDAAGEQTGGEFSASHKVNHDGQCPNSLLK